MQKILLDETGLAYICETAERFYAVNTVLANLIGALVEQPSARLLKHIVRCFLRLSDNARAREALRQCLPDGWISRYIPAPSESLVRLPYLSKLADLICLSVSLSVAIGGVLQRLGV